MNSVDGLLFDCWIPSWFKDEYIRRRCQIEPNAASFDGD
jgi:hypothetical protein